LAESRSGEAGEERDHAAEGRDQAGEQRDHAAEGRDQAADERDQAADERDQAADERDQAADEQSAWPSAGITTDAMHRSAVDREEAASDRRRASQDRRAGASERAQAERDRTTALADRGASAREREDGNALSESATKYHLLADRLAAAQQTAEVGSWEWDIPANRVSWSDELCRIFGLEPGNHPSTYEDYLTAVHPDDRTIVDAAVQHGLAAGGRWSIKNRVVLAHARLRIVYTRAEVEVDDAGTAVRMTGTLQDVTEREMEAEALRRSESRLAEAQSTARLGSWEWCIATDQVMWSDELFNLFGVDRSTFVATYEGYLDQVHPKDRELVSSAIGEAYETRDEFGIDHRVMRSNGEIAWIHSRGRIELGADGEPERLSGTAVDITERIALQQELGAMALVDDLTGLHNRRGFVTLAEYQLKVAGRAGRRVPLLFVDMDGLKAINDTYGHNAGDEALVEVAEFLRAGLRSADLVARVGGDEFCILMVDDDGSNTDVEHVVAELRSGPAQGQHDYRLPLSVGVAWMEPGACTSVEDLMGRADVAMYQDKGSQQGLTSVLVVEDDSALRSLIQSRLDPEYEVSTAATGETALEEASGHMPHMILLDLNLPDMHGADLLRRLRVLPGGDAASVIAWTVEAGPDAELESLREGVDDFMRKPLNLDILNVRMRSVLRRTSLRSRRLGD